MTDCLRAARRSRARSRGLAQPAPWRRCWPMLLLGSPTVARAQESPSRPGLPSDSVVRLAVDPARNPGRPVVVLLDESTVRLEADGRYTQRARQVLQVLSPAVAAQAAERAFTYARDHQQLQIDWVRVLRPDGTVISDRPAQEQEGDVAATLTAPVYSDQRVRRLSLAGVSAGVVVDVAYTLTERAPRRPGDVLVQWSLNGPVPVRRSQLTVDVPEGYRPQLVERHLVQPRTTLVANGRQQFVWRASDQPPVPVEPFGADSNDLQQQVIVGAPGTWRDLAQWYDSLARPRYVLSAAVMRRADSVLAARGARTRADTIRAWHRWVAQDIRYLSVALGMGSYQPRSADEVLATGAGDCKDKTTLFVALLRRAGIAASPVLLNLNGRLVAGAPSVGQFNHAIAAVRDGTTWTLTDLTAGFLAYGELPASYQGGRGVRVEANGDGMVVALPAASVTDTRATLRLTYRFDALETATGEGRERAAGPATPAVRTLFATPLDAARRAAVERRISQQVLGSDGGVDARVDSLTGFDGRDLEAVPAMRFSLRVERATRLVGATRVLAVPAAMRGPARQFRSAVRDLEAAGPRRLPIDASRIIPPVTTELEWQVTLPDGWTVELPPPVVTRSFFGQYESRWTLRGRELTLVRRLQGERGVVGRERMVEVLVWLRTVGADDQEYLTMMPVARPLPEGAH